MHYFRQLAPKEAACASTKEPVTPTVPVQLASKKLAQRITAGNYSMDKTDLSDPQIMPYIPNKRQASLRLSESPDDHSYVYLGAMPKPY